MEGDKIPDEHHISRLCFPKHVDEGQVQSTAFMLREKEPYLSVDWLEIMECVDREEEINKLRVILGERLRVGATAKIAIANVGDLCGKVQTETPDSRKLDVLHLPIEKDDGQVDLSHSGIYNLKEDDELIAELILESVSETHQARS